MAKKSVLDDIFNAPDNSALGIIKNTIKGLPKAAADYASGVLDGDIGKAFGNENLNATPAGVAANTVLGIPKAAVPVAADSARQINDATAGAAIAQFSPSQTFTPSSPLSQAIFGSSSIPDLYDEGRQAFMQHGVDPKTASVLGLPFGIMNAIGSVYAGEDGSALEAIAHSENPERIQSIISSEYPALKEQAPALSQALSTVSDPKQAGMILRDALNKKTADGIKAAAASPDLTYVPTEEEAQTQSLEHSAQQATPTEEHLPQQHSPGETASQSQPEQVLPPPARETGQPPLSKSLPEDNKTTTKDQMPFHEGSLSDEEPYKASISENNGGIEPPVNKGGLRVPEIDFTTGKEPRLLSAPRMGINTMERNIENIFPRDTASTIKSFLIDPVRANETERMGYINSIRKQVKSDIVDKLGIHVGSKESELLQRYGEGRMTLSELMKESPKKADNIIKANSVMRKVYDDLLNKWNDERANAGLAPVAKRADYFRHFQDMHSFMSMFSFMSKRPELPTSISGITENFRSRAPWASAAMRRLGGPFTEDALKGLDQYLNTTSRAIFHTDSVQRGRLFEKYLRDASSARIAKGLPDLQLPNFASNLNDWVNLVSGKQAKLDRAIESAAGRQVLPAMSKLASQFSKNVIGGSISSAITHAIPLVFTLATTDTRSSVLGLLDTLRSPFTDDFTVINGVKSGFLTRRFGTNAIEKTILQKGSDILGSPFHAVDQFISRFAVSAKYAENLKRGMEPEEAMKSADTYAARTIGDRSTGNLPNLLNTKTLGLITQFQVEVNDNLQVLLHDIPYEQQGNAKSIAGMYVKFAIYSYLFNQVMQNIKGSGKGLDPIDLGLTLAGLNSEGKGKSLLARAGLTANDFAKELPFTSIPTGGQIPALGPATQAISKVSSGDVAGGLEQAATDYLSPIGGGVQAQKTIEGISDVNKGQTSNSKGQMTAVIPKTPTNYVKGALFGPAAFPEQQAATAKQQELFNLLQQNKSGQTTVKAIEEADRLKQVDSSQGHDAANAAYESLKASDPALAKAVLTQINNEKLGLTKEQLMIKQLGVSNGQRAKYLAEQFNSATSTEAKKALWEEYVKDKIITAEVSTQLIPLLNK